MNMPCSNTALLDCYLSEQDAAEIIRERYERQFPIESFMPEAEHYALGEGAVDLAYDFALHHADAAYRLLMTAAGKADALDIPGYLETLVIADQSTFHDFRESWIKDYAEDLRQARIDVEVAND